VNYAALPPDELVLICLRTDEEPAWSEFVRRFHPLIARVVFRVCQQWGERSPQLMDDLVQDTYLKLCSDRMRVLRMFKPKHSESVYGYIKVLTANLVHDHFKAARSKKRGGAVPMISVEDNDIPGTSPVSALKDSDQNLLAHQIDTCLRAVCTAPSANRDRRIFWLYYRVGLSASAIAALPGIGLSTKGVETALLRLTRLIRERLTASGRRTRTEQEKGFCAEESL
jgi:RNA polymerase sigma-70 factor (ECF subfamily)